MPSDKPVVGVGNKQRHIIESKIMPGGNQDPPMAAFRGEGAGGSRGSQAPPTHSLKLLLEFGEMGNCLMVLSQQNRMEVLIILKITLCKGPPGGDITKEVRSKPIRGAS